MGYGDPVGELLDRVRELGADRLATGHYARLEAAGYGPALFRGLDPSKDQSYFLSMVPRERFERDYIVRTLAAQQGNISRTAEFVGMERSALHRKLKALGVG